MISFLNFFFLLQVPQGSLGMYLLYSVLIIKLKSTMSWAHLSESKMKYDCCIYLVKK